MTLVAATLAPPASAQGVEQPIIELFDPLVTRNPTPERELEVNVEYEKGDEGKEVEAEIELSWRFGQRFEVSIEVPILFLMPREGSDESGWATSRSAARSWSSSRSTNPPW